MPAGAGPTLAEGPARLPGRTSPSAAGAAARSAGAAGAGQPGDAAGGRGGYGPHACRLRGVCPTAATDGGDQTPELPTTHLPGETGRPGAPGRQLLAGTCFAPGRARCRGRRSAADG